MNRYFRKLQNRHPDSDIRKRGGITVFLTMVLFILMGVVMKVVSETRQYAVKTEGECMANIGMDSCFAEYNRELLDRYDLFFIDLTYGGEKPSIGKFCKHLEGYLKANLADNDSSLWRERDFLNMELSSVKIEEYHIASDDNGRDVHNQAVDYMKDLYGISLVEGALADFGILRENRFDVTDMEKEAETIRSEIGGEYEELSSIGMPADISEDMSGGILPMVMRDPGELSDKVTNLSDLSSNRNLVSGYGAYTEDEGISLTDDALFTEYLLDKCGFYRSENEDGALDYEAEYILCGKNNDIANLNFVLNRIFMIRWAADAAYIFTDSEKCNEAEIAATAFSLVIEEPQATPYVKDLLLIGWAFAEALSDTKRIYRGGRVPILKTYSDWRMTLTGVMNGEYSEPDISGEKGLLYKDYLRFLLLLQNKEEKTMRFMDVIEMNLRKTQGNAYFRIDGCVSAVKANIEICGMDGDMVDITKEYSYFGK